MVDVAGFLHRFPPFDGLSRERLDRVAGTVRVETFPAGAVILQQAGEPACCMYVVIDGAVELLSDGRLLDLMGEGEIFGYLSLVTGLEPTATIRAHEDTRCYLLDKAVAEEVLGTPEGAAFMAEGMRHRLAIQTEGRGISGADLAGRSVGSFVGRPPVTCDAGTSVGEAANRMAEERVSAVMVRHGDRLGILTDADLRTRVIAPGRGSQTPVEEVATFPAVTARAGARASEALFVMIEGGFHHLAVVDESGGVRGVVEETDLLAVGRHSPFAVIAAIERAGGRDAAIDAAQDLPDLVASLVDANLDPVEVGHVVGLTVDALTRRLLALAVADGGEPPAPWAWLAFGSLARHEQSLHTDQDHAIAFEPGDLPIDQVDPYFARLAGSVTEGLAHAGIPRCRAGIIAENRGLRRPLADWEATFRKWIGMTSAWEAGGAAAIVFDYRRVAGPLEVESTLNDVIRSVRDDEAFLQRLAENALDNKPPTGFFHDFVVEAEGSHAGKLDVKHGGILPITDLARLHALGAGLSTKRTLDRLSGSAAAGRIDEETRSGLDEAFRLLWQTRLEHQVDCVRRGEPADDYVDPRSLGPVTRRSLKESFRVIARAQRQIR